HEDDAVSPCRHGWHGPDGCRCPPNDRDV
ncbi:hypothetical protein BN1708_018507, partial [Verticillium longisporum]